jgi:6-hydroxycyclohex-1-ene-1-carbonyl-CoA dehydrogenase
MSSGVALVCTAPRHVELCEVARPEVAPGEALVRVAGCGLCHTDVGFYTGAVRPRRPLPLVLGHEIAGVVAAAHPPFEHLVGRQVIVPAVMPCGRCDLCLEGRDNACAAQVMPGNDIAGGFASYLTVPAAHLVPLDDDLGDLTLAELAVVADAVTTPYQALRRAGAGLADLVVVIGAGGIGIFAVQIARALGAEVAAVDIAETRRLAAASVGARWIFDPAETDGRAIKKRLLAESGIGSARWRVLEMSGTARGQELAWSLLPPAGTLGVVGFTMEKPDIRLSNLMALDATAFGSWGCSPRLYPAVIDLVVKGRIQVRPFIELHPLADGGALLESAARHQPNGRRPILVPPPA